MPEPDERPAPRDPRADRIEALVGLISAVVVLIILGVLAVEALRPLDAHADLVAVESEASGAEVGQLRFEVVNRGDRAATAVTVALILGEDGAEADKRTAIVDFVPSHSRARGAFMISEAQRGLRRQLLVESYLDP